MKYFLFILALMTVSCSARDTFEAKETELQAFERHNDSLLDVQKPLYRLGEILIQDNDQYVVPVAYHWRKDHWSYDCVAVKVKGPN